MLLDMEQHMHAIHQWITELDKAQVDTLQVEELVQSKVHPYVTSFLQCYPQHFTHPKSLTSHSYPTADHWEKVSRFLCEHDVLDFDNPEHLILPVFVGYLGPFVGVEFVKFCTKMSTQAQEALVWSGRYTEIVEDDQVLCTLVHICLFSLQVYVGLVPPTAINKFFKWASDPECVEIEVVQCALKMLSTSGKESIEGQLQNPELSKALTLYKKICV